MWLVKQNFSCRLPYSRLLIHKYVGESCGVLTAYYLLNKQDMKDTQSYILSSQMQLKVQNLNFEMNFRHLYSMFYNLSSITFTKYPLMTCKSEVSFQKFLFVVCLMLQTVLHYVLLVWATLRFSIRSYRNNICRNIQSKWNFLYN